METRVRSLVKALLWNLMGLVSMTAVGFATTGSVLSGGIMALVNTGIGFTMYLFYERAWANVRWGRHV
ncbi:MAG: DUF2061 domain-containing protein [Rhodobacteraceae bacterium]|nr:DUF2061 domain-containing protein [Paracoccaceae bacterium]